MTLFSVMFGFLSLYFLCISQRFLVSVTVVVYLGGLVAKSGLTLVTPCTIANQAPPVHGTSQARMLEWVPFLFPGDLLPDPGVEPGSLHCRLILY